MARDSEGRPARPPSSRWKGGMDKVLGDRKAIMVLVGPPFALFLLFMVFPIFASGFYSLVTWDGLSRMAFSGVRNYVALFTADRAEFFLSVRNSVIIALLSVFVQLPIALLLALALASGMKGESVFRTIYFIPVVVSSTMIGVLFLVIYNPDIGLLNGILKGLGFIRENRAWLGDQKFALYYASVPIIWQFVGYHMLLMYAGIRSIPRDIIEAARIDGASAFQTAVRIKIPLITSVIEVCVILAVTGALRIFDLMYVLTGNGAPLGTTIVQTGLMYRVIFDRNQYGMGSAIALVILVECLLVTILTQRGVGRRSYGSQ
jgi:raffinose/stachyose/melibiose transport system permease protein